MVQRNKAELDLSSERLLVFMIFSVLTLEGNHQFVEDFAIDVTEAKIGRILTMGLRIRYEL